MYFRAEILDAEEKVCGLLRLHPNISFHNLHFEKEESPVYFVIITKKVIKRMVNALSTRWRSA